MGIKFDWSTIKKKKTKSKLQSNFFQTKYCSKVDDMAKHTTYGTDSKPATQQGSSHHQYQKC
jgi:hypothetical protein